MKRVLVCAALLAAGCSSAGPRSGIDTSCMDKSVRPQDDLFRAVNGAWLARTEIPPDRSIYGAFEILREKTELDCKSILDRLLLTAQGDEERKLADFYASYMDEARVNELGASPIAAELAAVQAIQSRDDLRRCLAALKKVGVQGAFRLGVSQDSKNSEAHLLSLSQDGLGLPDRDYYLKPKYKEKLDAYEPHVARMLELAGVKGAKEQAATIVAFETEIAKVHWGRIESRDDSKRHNKMTREELAKTAPGFDWSAYIDDVGAPASEQTVEVAQVSFFVALGKMFETAPLETWKAWLAWRIVHSRAEVLGKDLAQEDFAFYQKKLSGVPEERPRWKRAVQATNMALGEALGKLYVAEHYPEAARERMTAMVQNLIAAYRDHIGKAEWMSEETRKKALAKLDRFTPKIGHTKKWRDYSSLQIDPLDLAGNIARTHAFEWARQLAKLGHPVDRDEWHMLPQTVNAYYSESMNEIVFPAAILQPPFFDLEADDAVNYGGIGAVIGHEIGHGFDDQGSKWDGAGNLVDWWTREDRAEFEKRAGMLAAQYDGFEPYPGFKVQGKLTLGENLGDLGGVAVSHAAYHMSLGGKAAPVIDGLTGDQRFFMGFAQVWRAKVREDEAKRRLATDPHSPPEYRANGPVRNVDAFYEAFGVKEGDRMYIPPAERVRIW
jgi:putative endopeptidase